LTFEKGIAQSKQLMTSSVESCIIKVTYSPWTICENVVI